MESNLFTNSGFFGDGATFADAITAPADANWFKIFDGEAGEFLGEGDGWMQADDLADMALESGRYMVQSWGAESGLSGYQSMAANVRDIEENSFVSLSPMAVEAGTETTLDTFIDASNLSADAYVRVLVEGGEDYGWVRGDELSELTFTREEGEGPASIWVDTYQGGERGGWANTTVPPAAGDEDPEEPGVPGETFTLTPSSDDLSGDSANNTFEAPIGTIDFQNGNTLNSGDSLDGGGGNNTLNAELIDDSFVTGGSGAVRPSTENIQNVIINAIDTDDSDGVRLDAADMVDLENVWSLNSNADLRIEDVNTLTSGGEARNTEELTFRMDHTSNDNTSEATSASDLSVYFDDNYLLSGQVTDDSTIQYRVMNQDAFDAGQDNDFDLPLISVTFADLRFTLEGNEYDLADFMEEDDLTGEQIQTYQDMADAMNAALDQLRDEFPDRAELADVEAFLDGSTFEDPDGREGEVVSLSAPGEFELGFPTANPNNSVFLREAGENAEVDGVTVESSNRFDRAQLGVDAEETDLPVTTNLELHKVGRTNDGSDGGDVLIGAKSGNDGIEAFNVSVIGDDSKPSNVGYIGTTNEELRTVDIDTDDTTLDSFASLTISNGFGADGSQQSALIDEVNADDFLGDLTIGQQLFFGEDVVSGGITNVAAFSATGGGDVEYNADYRTGLDHTIQTGGGDDTINVNLDGSSSGSVGSQTTVDIDASGGDNTINLWNEGGGPSGDDELNNEATVSTGSGDDVITGRGTNLTAESGAGDDVIYAENTGDFASAEVAAGVFTDDTDGFGGGGEGVVEDFQLLNGRTVTVTVAVPGDSDTDGAGQFENGFEVTSVIDGEDDLTTERDVYEAAADAINDDPIVSNIAEASVNSDGDLVVEYLVDGAWDTEEDLVEIAIADEEDPWDELSNSQQNAIVEAVRDANNDSGIEASDIADAYNGVSGEIVNSDATNGDNSTDEGGSNTVNAGTGDDLIVLSSDDETVDTVVFDAGTFGNNTIVHFNDDAPDPEEDVQDVLDFTAWLDNTVSESGSTGASESRIETVYDATGSDFEANGILNQDFSTGGDIDEWSDLLDASESELLGWLDANGFGSVEDTDVVGDEQNSILMVENDDNAGEYAVFQVVSDAEEDGFDSIESIDLVGTVDFGETQEDLSVDNFA